MVEDEPPIGIVTERLAGLLNEYDLTHTMASSLIGEKLIAEGIEIVEHYRALLDMGCELGQGYCIARPMPADELFHWWPE